MRKIFIVAVLSLFICGCINNPVAKEHPTKEEWLEVSVTQRVKQLTDLWQHRTALLVAVRPEEQVVVIILTSANGQEEISQSAKDGYLRDVEEIATETLEKHDWAKDFKITVQYVY